MAKPKKKSCSSSCCSESYTRPKPEFVKTDRVCHPMRTEDGKMPRTEYDEIFRKMYDQHALSMDYDLVTIQENYPSDDSECQNDNNCTESGFTCQRVYGSKRCTKSCSPNPNADGGSDSDCPSGYTCVNHFCEENV